MWTVKVTIPQSCPTLDNRVIYLESDYKVIIAVYNSCLI